MRRLLTETAEPTSYSLVRSISPASMIDALVVVPPMSRVITLGKPAACATSAAATTPAAGPDSMIVTGARAAVIDGMRPPFDCMTSSGADTPRSRSRARSTPR